MKNTTMLYRLRPAMLAVAMLIGASLAPKLKAQNPEMQQHVADMKAAAVANKQALAQLTWTETVTISLKGEQKKVEHFQVRLGPDGKPQKTPLDAPAPPPQESGRRGRVKAHVVEKKKEEYKEYADQMKTLAQQYLPPEKDLIEQAYAKGGVTLAPTGAPGQAQLIIKNYLKPQDSLTLVVDKAQKQLLRVEVATYLSDAKDAMTVKVQFARVPDGSNQISNVVVDGVGKHLNLAIADSSYRRP